MQRHQRLLNLEASNSEILMDFESMNCVIDKGVEVAEVKKRGRKKKDKTAVCGVLGLASLISDRDGKTQQVPDDWFQPYPLISQNLNEYLPTGIPLQGKGLLYASMDIYYQGRIHGNS